jgi:ABC-type lipoprotein export system ATPase subunit
MPSDSPNPALEIENLRFRYTRSADAAPWVVDVRALRLARAEHLLLRGGSGTGKSTLLQLIAGLLDPVEGRVRIDGDDLHARHGAARDRLRGTKIGFVFQTFNLLHGFTAIENVMAAMMFSSVPRAEHRARADELLRTLGIERPHASIDRLSVGQQQRVAVARAVACDPVLVLADEPTASLDPENAAIAMGLIQETCRARGAALLCVSHDPSLTSRFARTESLASLRSDPSAQAPPASGDRQWR